MEYKGYSAKVEFDDEANIFHGEIINLSDVVTFEGETVDERRQAFKDSVHDYLEYCAQRGEDPEKTLLWEICCPRRTGTAQWLVWQ